MVKIRLRRMGKANRAYYRVVVSESRNVPTASSIEELGHYDPVADPAVIEINKERAQYWIDRGAQVSPSVKSLLAKV